MREQLLIESGVLFMVLLVGAFCFVVYLFCKAFDSKVPLVIAIALILVWQIVC